MFINDPLPTSVNPGSAAVAFLAFEGVDIQHLTKDFSTQGHCGRVGNHQITPGFSSAPRSAVTGTYRPFQRTNGTGGLWHRVGKGAISLQDSSH